MSCCWDYLVGAASQYTTTRLLCNVVALATMTVLHERAMDYLSLSGVAQS